MGNFSMGSRVSESIQSTGPEAARKGCVRPVGDSVYRSSRNDRIPFLGTMAGFAAKSAESFVDTTKETGKLARAERYELQAVLRGLISENRRIQGCLRFPRAGAQHVEIHRANNSGLAHYSGLQTCGRGGLCPACGAKIAEHNCQEIQAALDVWRERGGVPALMTFTMPHYRSQGLSDNLKAILAAYRALTGNGSYRRLCARAGLEHTIRASEITYGPRNGFHPHLHGLGLFGAHFDVVAFEQELARLWLANLQRQGIQIDDTSAVLLRGVRVQLGFTAGAEYISKIGRTWGLAEEVSKANRKKGRGEHYSPADLLRHVRDGTLVDAAAVFREYAAAIEGVHLLQWSRNMRDRLGLSAEKTDQEIAAGDDQADVVLALLTLYEWRAIRFAGVAAVIRVLHLADDDHEGALGYVQELVRRYELAVSTR